LEDDIPIAPSLYSLSNKMDNSLLAVRDINHKHIVVDWRKYMNKTEKTTFTVPSSAELEQLAELHKAMGDYTRIRILWYLMQKEYCVSDLAQKMEITESAISHQLRALRIARLVQSHKAGKNVIYSLQDEHIRWILEKTYDHISER